MPQQVDYAALAEQARKGTPAAVDYTALAAQARAPESGGIGHAAEEFWKRANPIAWAEGLFEAAKHPVDAAVNMVRADPAFLAQAKDAAQKGDYLTAGRKVLSYLSMGFGHDLDAQADMGAKGDLSGMAGAMAGTATQFLAPEAAVRGVTAAGSVARGMKPANPAVADAVALAKREGVPISAATATDNMAVRAAQHISDRSLGGAQIAGKAAQREAEGLATVGERLAAKAHPKAVTPEQAGQGVRDALHGKIRDFDAQADAAYAKLRDIAGQNVETVTTRDRIPAPADAPPAFTLRGNALPDEVFEAAYQDARKNGYTGSKDELRTRFDDQLKSGFSGHSERAAAEAEYGPESFLKAIRQNGGLKPFSKDIHGQEIRGDYASIVESFGAKSTWSQKGGGSIFRTGGKTIDDMVTALKHDPKWAHLVEDENGLLDMLDDIARQGRPSKAVKPGVEDALRITDARPGAKWWIDRTEESQALPVDLRGVRDQLRPIYDRLMQERELAPATIMGDKARALTALDTLMRAKDFAPLEIADKALSDLKAMARGKSGSIPELRTEGQGAAAAAVRALDAQVRAAAAKAGPEAARALDTGRRATAAKYAVADVYDAIKEEPVKAFSAAVSPKDSAIGALRQVAKHAPDELPKIGRAYLDSLLEKATEDGSFSHADKLWADWQRMGPETKRMLFKDPAHVKDLDSFFLLAKQAAKNANPSGTAHTAAMLAQGATLWEPIMFASTVIGGAGVSTFLHSPAGVRLLTEGLKLPRSQAARAAWMTKVRKFGAAQGSVMAAQPAGSSR